MSMVRIHELLTAEFGRMAAELEDDGRLQPVLLPGGTYVVLVEQSSEHTITVRKPVGRPDFTRPGLAAFLLSEPSHWLFGRYGRVDDMLAVEHTLSLDALTPALLSRVVRVVHEAACDAEHTLVAIGALERE
jgi:hypothetical protein